MSAGKSGKGPRFPGGAGVPGRVLRLPGIHCRFHERGHCAVEETMNPGLNDGWRCGEEQRIVRAYDHFLEQADVFDLSVEQAATLWERRLTSLPPPGGLCPEYTPPVRCPSCADGCGGEEGWLDCTHFREGACMLLLPRCDGICERFQGR